MTEAFSFFKPINRLPGVRAGFIGRIPGVDVSGERDEALSRLLPAHQTLVKEYFDTDQWWCAEQVHGAEVVQVPNRSALQMIAPGTDGLVTTNKRQVLGIYVADCGPIWLADCDSGAVGLLHSGKVGTQLNILAAGVKAMQQAFGTKPESLVVALGPCIRPPYYDVDFAAEIGRQAERAKVKRFVDCGVNTGDKKSNLYSYRMEGGKTGRMLALVMRE